MTKQHRLPDWRTFIRSWRWSGDNAAALLLAISALATAWSSYQASVWGGVQSAKYTLSSVLREKATAANDEAERRKLLDVLLFTKWLDAYIEQRPRLEAAYESRFRSEFRVAFDAWRKDSTHLGDTPFDRPEYQSAKAMEADRDQAAANRALRLGEHANGVSDQYVFQTVIFATVLFFAGAVRPLVGPRLRTFLLLLAALLCVTAVVHLAMTPAMR